MSLKGNSMYLGAGANFDFSGGKIRLTANYVSRKIGESGCGGGR
jgi:hypothetical protein